MNVNFCVAALSQRGRNLLPAIWEEALRRGGEAYDTTNGASLVTEDRAVFNARAADGIWKAPTWIESDGDVLALSQPPVSYVEEVAEEAWTEWTLRTLRDDAGRRSVHPGYFGIQLSRDGSLEAWNDLFGFGRSYYVHNDDFVVVGNQIAMVSLFCSEPLTVDEYGCDVQAQIGFWPENNSPMEQITRLGAAEVVSVSADGVAHRRTYSSPKEWFGYREVEPDFQAVADSLRLSASNCGAIAVEPPAVHLSGGQDSRVTAAAWIAGGKPARVITNGTLPGEVAIAQQLMDALDEKISLEDRGITYKIKESNVAEYAEFSMEDRLRTAMLMWDGDFATGNLKGPVRMPPRRGRLTIGGANGEVMHGIHYATEATLEAVRKLSHPVDKLFKQFPGRYNTAESRPNAVAYLERCKQFTIDMGHTDATALNVFQMTSKYRRWINNQMGAAYFILLLNPVFVRTSLDLTPEQRVDRLMQRKLAGALIPSWEDIPYYKSTLAESTTINKAKANRSWETAPGYMEHLLQDRSRWKRYFDPAKMHELEEAVYMGEGHRGHETILHHAYTLDAIPDHVAHLEHMRRALWARVS
ncbi:hypothetical protein [Nesterenkonia lutea]|uniref:Asparagine synthase n=1 Tax=Nesterenkonia lutea TaxID=272919 RepID=A0ABR9JBT9_9MICC|nr:hypothetical protein [Nesterenkonia lutea]MBE1523396.1 hypothetical protein [Nesterenkonia lutea]